MEPNELRKLNLQTEINLKLVLIAELKQMMIQYEGIFSKSENSMWGSTAYSLEKIDHNIQKRAVQIKHEQAVVEALEKELAELD